MIKSFEYKDVGITLDITPHVSQGGMIRLEIKSEFTKLIEDVTNPSTDTPTTAKRKAQTVVTMRSGSTVVIGGLIRDDTVTVRRRCRWSETCRCWGACSGTRPTRCRRPIS